MRFAKWALASSLATLLAACAMPQPTSVPQKSSGSSSSQGSQSSSGSSGSQGSQGSSGSSGSQGSQGSSGSPSSQGSSGSSGSSSSSGGAGGGATVGEQLPWPGEDMGSSGNGGLDQEFEDSLGDFEEAVAGGTSGGGGVEEIDILNPMGGASSGAPSDEPLFEEGDLGEEGDMAENQSVAQRAASGSPQGSSSSSSSSSGGSQGDGGEESGNKQSPGQSTAGGGGGEGAQQGNRAVGASSASGAEEGGENIVPIPEDIGDGRNDDIVLRQIREAAMNERDPVMREKLWDEYRRIRGAR